MPFCVIRSTCGRFDLLESAMDCSTYLAPPGPIEGDVICKTAIVVTTTVEEKANLHSWMILSSQETMICKPLN